MINNNYIYKNLLVYPNISDLKRNIANKFIENLIAIQEKKHNIHLVLTGGQVGIGVLQEIGKNKNLNNVDWHKVHFWWGDERFLELDNKDRNDKQAFDALLHKINYKNIHQFPSPKNDISLKNAANIFNSYMLSVFAKKIKFDIVLLGLGEDAHIASLFPEKPNLKNKNIEVLFESKSPKPPSERLTMSLAMLSSADKVWFTVAGKNKALAVKSSLREINKEKYPASSVKGIKETLWFIDKSAASFL